MRSNDNGVLPIYRKSSYCVDARVEDLISRMTLEEKAGQLFQTQLYQGPNGMLHEGDSTTNSTDNLIGEKHMTHFNLVGDITDARQVAEFVNLVQQRALDTRLGIPWPAQWPETLGLAALRDVDLVKKFAEVAREEYIAVGIRSALHPQVDLATEPRWARLGNTWGENATLTSELLVAYIQGFQGKELGPPSVTTITKHFPGGGPMQGGEDSHFTYGKNQTYPGRNFEYHLQPFKAAIAAGARQMMPYYSRPTGTMYEPVGFSFNKQIGTDLLRRQLGFKGIVVTDWGLITDTVILGQDMPARAWGLENTTELQRVARILDAGCDQFGGEQRPELVVQLVKEGVVAEERLDDSLRRLLREKFILGLFDRPFVDPEAAARIVGNDYFARLGNDTQRRAYTLLADKNGILSMLQSEKARQASIYSRAPTIVDINMDRPAAIPEVVDAAAAVLASYGSGGEAFLDVVFGINEPEGKLPFDLPRSMHAVVESMEDVPYDTKDPVFRFGHGLRYTRHCETAEVRR
ncbi:periplasmic beta-glucosidase beta-xylosidase [Colletotrichum musicola]|uniref:beta-glucosidase n=1 Tax=Colletotrichum musicola TaxID=2175873 RepID=A0A8H6NB61_9PEZI|nr:periplasmic beta-glucosidase beta-xylosidase [Colletotrichum musicola]